MNEDGGWRLVATVGGVSPLGLHAHLLVVDDPIDPKSARGMTETKLRKRMNGSLRIYRAGKWIRMSQL